MITDAQVAVVILVTVAVADVTALLLQLLFLLQMLQVLLLLLIVWCQHWSLVRTKHRAVGGWDLASWGSGTKATRGELGWPRTLSRRCTASVESGVVGYGASVHAHTIQKWKRGARVRGCEDGKVATHTNFYLTQRVCASSTFTMQHTAERRCRPL